MEINWTLLTYIVVGLFTLSGFFKGWWKEAIVTFFLAILIFFLQAPGAADWAIGLLNQVEDSLREFLSELEISAVDNIPPIDAGNGGTWLTILILFVGVAVLIGRSGLPNTTKSSESYSTYVVRPIGGILGGLLGGLNGFLIVNLVREYLDGRNLPGSTELPVEIEAASAGTVGIAPSGISIQAVDLPQFTILDNFLPWIIIAIGLLLLLSVLSSRIASLRKKKFKPLFGYTKWDFEKKEDKFVFFPVVLLPVKKVEE